ncbi:MAG TPA: chloride channel protein [Holophagaceae bacterium]|jgi:CIC family chloride channel protein|nr:chloride channel protein [Holophagaceae bacterium]
MSATGQSGAPSSEPPRVGRELDARAVWISGLAVLVGIAAGFVARFLAGLIGFITNIAYFHRLSWSNVNPWDHALGWMSVLVPVLGGLLVGLMARHGSKGIRGHGIPEAMEQVLYNRSRIQPRLMILKPLSAAIAIGTGGPFGLEGPIIATGGAMGSVLGQLMPSTPDERKTLLGAGAAAGMAATFGSPISAVLLAVELLLFEYRARSFVPVALAATSATAVRLALAGPAPAFPMTDLMPAGPAALALCVVVGAATGALSAPVTQALFKMEDLFAKLPIHWALWPALGGVAVGLIGLVAPRSLGVGYDNITDILSGRIVGWAVVVLCAAKFVSWAIALGSGTSGGTLAPLFTVGGGFGAVVGLGLAQLFPSAHLDPRMAALVGMAALFTGASRAMLTSVVFAVEATRQPWGILPLLAGCAVAYMVSSQLMATNIMTDRMTRRGSRVPTGLGTDPLDQMLVADGCSKDPATLSADMTAAEARAWLREGAPGSEHRAFPLLEGDGRLAGLLSRSRLLEAEGSLPLRAIARATLVSVPPGRTLREAGDLMASTRADVLIVADPAAPDRLLGLLTLRDLLEARSGHMDRAASREPAFEIMPGTQVFRAR